MCDGRLNHCDGGDLSARVYFGLYRDHVCRGPDCLGQSSWQWAVDPIWLGIMIAINLQTSFLTPPFGFCAVLSAGRLPKIPSRTADIYRGGRALHRDSVNLTTHLSVAALACNLAAWTALRLVAFKLCSRIVKRALGQFVIVHHAPAISLGRSQRYADLRGHHPQVLGPFHPKSPSVPPKHHPAGGRT